MRVRAVLLCLALAACSSEPGTMDREEIVGTYTLVSINGAPLPQVNPRWGGTAYEQVLVSSRLDLRLPVPASHWDSHFEDTPTGAPPGSIGGEPQTIRDEIEVGWTPDGDSLTVFEHPTQATFAHSGTVSPTEIRLTVRDAFRLPDGEYLFVRD